MNFLKTASVCPKVVPAHPEANADEIIRLIKDLEAAKVQVAVFPELAVTGATVGDLLFQDRLWTKTAAALDRIREASRGNELFFVVGSPFRTGHLLFNAAVAFQNGRILGVVPKTHLSSNPPLNETRWFSSPLQACPNTVSLGGEEVPFGALLFQSGDVTLGIEIGDDLTAPSPPSQSLALSGADLILCPAASFELAGKAAMRRQLVTSLSGRCQLGYVYASAGVDESTTDLLYSGHLMIAENGELLLENDRFQTQSEYITTWIDVEKLKNLKLRNSTLRTVASPACTRVPFTLVPSQLESFDRPVDPSPFIPEDPAILKELCQEIFAIQSHALARRMRAAGLKKYVLGISGGLDSTLALLVAVKARMINGGNADDIITVTMPGFGTMDRTYGNAIALCRGLGADLREINIEKASLQHFKDIGHDPSIHDSTYENTQARERTQILMDIANKEGGLVVGTGDLSELVLGWATYNGDHMSMYGVNASVPKTLVRALVRYAADFESIPPVREVLKDITETPVSPELLPKNGSDEFVQKTEDLIGPYELHDFFLYHMLLHGADPDKILFLASHAFRGKFSEETIRSWLKVFLKRFFTSQFKRSALPDGPKVGPVAISPRGDLIMPSDATWRSWSIE